MQPEARKKVFGIFIIVLLLIVSAVVCILYFGNVFKDSDSKKVGKDDGGASKNDTLKGSEDDEEDTGTSSTSPGHTTTTSGATTTTTGEVTTTTEYWNEEEVEEYRVQLNLSPNTSTSSGKVYIATGNQLGFVCSDGFDDNAALVTCKELGYSRGFAYNLMRKGYVENYSQHEPILSGINCTGSEKKLSQCEGFQLTNETTCTWFAAAYCYDNEPFELRLFNGTYPNSGMVEMKVDGEWRLFCGMPQFDDDVADILCRMMNYTGGLSLELGTSGPTSYSKVWVPYIYCGTGAEIKESIFECEIILHTENILVDYQDFRSNRYNFQYMSCFESGNSFAAAVHCLGDTF